MINRRTLLLAFAVPALTACVPTVEVIQPGWTFEARTSGEQPAPDAVVTVVRWAYPHQRIVNRLALETDKTGTVRFRPQNAAGVWALIPGHGPTAHAWSWCAEAPGLLPVASPVIWRPDDVSQPIVVTLENAVGSGSPTCADEMFLRFPSGRAAPTPEVLAPTESLP